jgi:hypothetical protein
MWVIVSGWFVECGFVLGLVKDFSYEEKIHILFAQRLESGPGEFYPFIWTADLR